MYKRASARAEEAKHQDKDVSSGIQDAKKSKCNAECMKKASEKVLAEAQISKQDAEKVKAEGKMIMAQASKAKSKAEHAKNNICYIRSVDYQPMQELCHVEEKTRRGSPVDRRPSTAEAPPKGQIYPFSKMAVPFEPVMRF